MQSGLSRQLSVEDIGLPVLRSNNIVNGQIDLSDIKFWHLVDTKGSKTENYFLKKDDLLVNFINSLGKMGKSAVYNDELKRPTIFTTNLMRLNFKKNINTYFIYYFFNTTYYKNYIDKITKPAVNQASFTTKDFKKMELKIPTMPEQFKISKFLKHIDKKIELLENKLGYHQDFKKYLMQQIFTQKLRFNFTDEWEKYLLGDISLIGKGFTPSTSNPSFWDGDLKWLSIADMNQGKYINQTTKKITSDGSKNKEPVKKGTLLMSFKLSIGKLGILTEDMYTNEAICNFKWKNKDVMTEYMYYYLSSINILKYGSQAAKGITLNNETLSTIPVLLPSLEEQKKIINILSDVDLKISMLENSINDTSKFKKGLLQQMFNYVRILYNLFEILIFLDHLLIFLIVFHTHYYS